MSRMSSIIFMLCSVSIGIAVYAGDATEAAPPEQAPEQKQEPTPPAQTKEEEPNETQTAPEATPPEEGAEPEQQQEPASPASAEEEAPKEEPAPESEESPEIESVQTQEQTGDAVENVIEPPRSSDEPIDPQEESAPDSTTEQEGFQGEKVVVLEATPEEESLPLPPDPASEPMVEDLELVEPQGIDTVDVNEPEGNWLFKRIWWEKSKELFGKIRDYVDKIVESRMHFFEERVKLDRDRLDPFYVAIGLDQGALMQQIDHLLGLLQRERQQDGVLNEQELELYNVLTEEKVTLNQLHEAVLDIQRVDSALDQSLQILMEQINLARAYEREAWQLFNQIAEELSDKKAHEHQYEIATIWRNVKEIGAYIRGPFAQHFVQLASSTVQRIDQIQDAVERLKEKGIELSKEGEFLHQHDCDLEEEEDLEEVEEPIAPVGWFDWIWQTVTGWFTW